MTDLMSANTCAPSTVRKVPEPFMSDFHAQLHHAQVLFGLIVGEGDCEVGEKP